MADYDAQDKSDVLHMLAIFRLLSEGDPPGSNLITCDITPLYRSLIQRYRDEEKIVTDEELWAVGVKVQLTYKGEVVEWKELALDPKE